MSLQIGSNGSRDGVLKHLLEQTGPDAKIPPGTDRAQMDAVRVLVETEIAALATEINGVRLIVDAVSHAGGRNINVQILPLKLHI